MSTNLRSADASAPTIDGTGRAVALVCGRFNDRIVEQLERGARRALTDHGVAADAIATWWVPGALEVPQVARTVAASGRFDAVVALGAVVRGDTYHFEVVSDRSAHGVMQVSLEHAIPIANAILTVDTDEQAHARTREKGTDAARVAIEMANLGAALATLTGDDDDDEQD